MLYRAWNIQPSNSAARQALADFADAGPLLRDVLVARGLDSAASAMSLLNPPASLSSPFLLKDMDAAVTRIHRAIAEGEPMVIFGDYDADGITATALLYTCLENMGAQVFYKLANRSDDGYGLSTGIVDAIADRGISLIITVDNGTSAVDAAERAAERGVDLIITDHHLPPEELPQVAALVNPCRADDESPFGNFSGVGVAFMLAAALEDCPPLELVEEYGDLAAIGTVADVMKLTGENRTLVKEGLTALQHTTRPGLAALISGCGWGQDKEITVENISYSLAPRLNAAGRMDDATAALRLLLAETQEEANRLVEQLQLQNAARQQTEQQIVTEISALVEADPSYQQDRILVVWGNGWHQGVIGVVSSRLVDKYAKPAIVISLDQGEGRGSGRSMRGLSLYSAIASCEDILIRFGGHDLAAGLSIKEEHLPEFRRRITAWAAQNAPVVCLPELTADAAEPISLLTLENVQDLARLSPCGSGNPAPRFVIQNAAIEAVSPMSEGRHCRLRLRQNNDTLSAVLFGVGPDHLAYRAGDCVDALVSLSIYEGREGRASAQVSARVIDLRPAGLGNVHVAQSALFESFSAGGTPSNGQRRQLAPSREDTARVWRTLRGNGPVAYSDLRPLFARLGEEHTGRILTSLAALEELGLLHCNPETGCYETVQVTEKRDLASSALLRRLEVV